MTKLATRRRPHEGPPLEDTGGHDVSDEAMRRLLLATVTVLAALVVVMIFVAGARWTTSESADETYGSADIGFLQDMIDHHEQALLIASTYLDGNPDGGAALYASEVILFQQRELDRMDAWLSDAGMSRGSLEREAMTWMAMPTSVDEMPGMQAPARIAELGRARGARADRLFFDMMSEHHLGGAHMASAAATAARRADIRDFAARMADNQRIEVVEYEQAIERLGL